MSEDLATRFARGVGMAEAAIAGALASARIPIRDGDSDAMVRYLLTCRLDDIRKLLEGAQVEIAALLRGEPR